MNGARAIVFALLTGLFFASCEADEAPAYTAGQMAQVVVASQTGLSEMNVLTHEDRDFANRLEDVYLLDADTILTGAIHYAGGIEAAEIAVLELAENAAPDEVEDALNAYKESRAGSFAGYFPRQAALVQNGVVAVKGDHVALLICGEPSQAETALLQCFGDEPPALPEPLEPEQAKPVFKVKVATEPGLVAEESPIYDMYDRRSILAAWESGNNDSLTPKNKAILEVCSKVIDELITEDMADYEKELAIHDWLCEWTEYDEGVISNEPDSKPHPDSENPYGPLVRRRSICGGYAKSFKLLMDMLGIECRTVNGSNAWGGERHMWNMVRLDDGEWYCVDVTWDDTEDVPDEENAPVNRKYFNVTSDFLRYNDHQWIEAGIPEATSGRFM